MKGSIWPRWLRALFAWRDSHEAGVWLYQENAVTGARRAVPLADGLYGPKDHDWLAHRDHLPPRPPAGSPAVFRVQARPLARCRTCRHWGAYQPPRTIGGGLAAECAIGDNNAEEPWASDQRAWAVGRGADGYPTDGELMTRPDFGCVSHEPREEQA